MGTKRSGAINLGILLTCTVSMLVGCSSASKKKSNAQTYGPDQPGVVVSDIPTPQPTESFGPTEPPPKEALFGPTVQQKKKIRIVFTPGLARSFAAAGALVALEEAGVEIESISGVEISGLIAGLYGFSHNQNEFEWWIQKLGTTDFVSKNLFSSFFKRSKISSAKLEEKVKQNLKSKKDFSAARVFLDLCANKEGGPVEQILRSAKTENLFDKPEGCDEQIWQGAEDDSARARTIILDLFGEPKAGLSKRDSELEEKYQRYQKSWSSKFDKAAIVIRPKLNDFDLLDFDRKTDIIFKGKEAVEAEVEKIKGLLK